MAGIVVLDTNVVLYSAAGRLSEPLPEGELAISFMTEMEVLCWTAMSTHEERELRSDLNMLNIIPMSDAIRDDAIRIRRRYGLKLPDAIIAATAVVLDAELWTSDTHFKRIEGLLLHQCAAP